MHVNLRCEETGIDDISAVQPAMKNSQPFVLQWRLRYTKSESRPGPRPRDRADRVEVWTERKRMKSSKKETPRESTERREGALEAAASHGGPGNRDRHGESDPSRRR